MVEYIIKEGDYSDEIMGELVRCKDCIHLHDRDCPIDWGKTDDDYCSFGEQEDEVENE